MKLIVAHVLILCATVLTTANPVQLSSHQVPLAEANGNNMAGAVNDKVPGHSDATYGPVPKKDQIFKVEFLDIAPTPIIAYVLFLV